MYYSCELWWCYTTWRIQIPLKRLPDHVIWVNKVLSRLAFSIPTRYTHIWVDGDPHSRAGGYPMVAVSSIITMTAKLHVNWCHCIFPPTRRLMASTIVSYPYQHKEQYRIPQLGQNHGPWPALPCIVKNSIECLFKIILRWFIRAKQWHKAVCAPTSELPTIVNRQVRELQRTKPSRRCQHSPT